MRITTFLTYVLGIVSYAHAQSTAGVTTRFWDCCKPSCSWSGKAAFSNPVTTCDIHDKPILNGGDATSGCDGGGVAFMCSSQKPFACNPKLAYGFAAVSGSLSEADTCCACYKLTFTSGPVQGNTMVVQAINIGNDVSITQFDLAIPGGGVGAFTTGCSTEWNAPPSGWGEQYGGVSSRSQCSALPSALQPGCDFRFDWMQGADNPAIVYERVACPAELIARTNCKRNDDGDYPAAPRCSTSGSGTRSHTTKRTSTHIQTRTKKTSTKTRTATRQPTQTLYGQCAGVGYNGPTKCPSGSACEFQNDYYSQCLP